MAKKLPPVSLMIVFVVLGVMLAVASNTYSRVPETSSRMSSELVGVVGDLEVRRVQLEDQLAGLRGRMAELEEQAAEDVGIRESFARELSDVRAAAGLTALVGEGVRVTMGDAASVPIGQDPNACLIHDFDLTAVVNALWVSGAEAISVNGERLVVTSSIRCAGNTVLVNATRMGSPYVIEAIGQSDGLAAGVRGDQAAGPIFDEYHTLYGLDTDIDKVNDIEIPAFRGSLRMEYALAAEGGSDS